MPGDPQIATKLEDVATAILHQTETLERVRLRLEPGKPISDDAELRPLVTDIGVCLAELARALSGLNVAVCLLYERQINPWRTNG